MRQPSECEREMAREPSVYERCKREIVHECRKWTHRADDAKRIPDMLCDILPAILMKHFAISQNTGDGPHREAGHFLDNPPRTKDTSPTKTSGAAQHAPQEPPSGEGELRRAIEAARTAVKRLYDEAEAREMQVAAGCYARAFTEIDKALAAAITPKGPTS